MSPLYFVRQILRAMSTAMTKNAHGMQKRKVTSALVMGLLVLGGRAVCCAETVECNGKTLNPYGDLTNNYMTDLKVTGLCDVNAPLDSKNRLLYVFQNVNIVGGGELKFHDDHDIDFYAESIVIEGTYIKGPPPTLNSGKLVAVSTQKGFVPEGSLASDVLPFQKRLDLPSLGSGRGCRHIRAPARKGRKARPAAFPTRSCGTANPIMADQT